MKPKTDFFRRAFRFLKPPEWMLLFLLFISGTTFAQVKYFPFQLGNSSYEANKIWVVIKPNQDFSFLNAYGTVTKVFQNTEGFQNENLKNLYQLETSTNGDEVMNILRTDSARIVMLEKLPVITSMETPPNDPYYTTIQQWEVYYQKYLKKDYAFDMEPAWGILSPTAFPNPVKVAITDEVMYSGHPDMIVHGGPTLMPGMGMSHGMLVGGVIAATTNNGIGMAGLAYNTTSHQYVEVYSYQMTYAHILLAAQSGHKIVNCSWASGITSIGQQIINEAHYTYGALIVAASGNFGSLLDQSDCSYKMDHGAKLDFMFPASFNNVISVTGLITVTNDDMSMDPADNYCYNYAMANDAVDISAYLDVLSVNWGDPAYTFGTSFAAPAVSGMAALVKVVNPSVNNYQMEYILKHTANSSIYNLPVIYGPLDPYSDRLNGDCVNPNGTATNTLGAGLVNGNSVLYSYNNSAASIPQVHADIDNTIDVYQTLNAGSRSILLKGFSNAPSCVVKQWRHSGKGQLIFPSGNPWEVYYQSAENDPEEVIVTLETYDPADPAVVTEAWVYFFINPVPITICASSTIDLNTVAMNYPNRPEINTQWSIVSGAGTLTNPNAVTATYNPNGNTGTVVIQRHHTFSRYDGAECSATGYGRGWFLHDYGDRNYTINVINPVISGPATVCPGETVVFNVSGVGARAVQWSVPSGMAILNGQNSSSIGVYVSSSFISGNIQINISGVTCGPVTFAVTLGTGCNPSCGDPTIPEPIWTSYFSGNVGEKVLGVTHDVNGNNFITGTGMSDAAYPSTSIKNYGTYTPVNGDAYMYVAKVNSNGSGLNWLTRISSNSMNDIPYRIVADNSGNTYVVGTIGTLSGFVATNIIGSNSGNEEGVVLKLDVNGNLVWSTVFAGPTNESIDGVYFNTSDGTLYVTGRTANLSTTSTNSFGGSVDAFICKLNVSTGASVWFTYFGGASNEEGYGVRTDAHGDPVITGTANGSVIYGPGPLRSYSGDYDAFTAKYNKTTGQLIWYTYFGGTGFEDVGDITITSKNEIILAGSTYSGNSFPTYTGHNYYKGNRDAFLAGIQSSDGQLIWARHYGGSQDEYARSIAIDNNDNIYIEVNTNSPDIISGNLAATPLSYQNNYSQNGDVLWARFHTTQGFVPELSYATYLNSVNAATTDYEEVWDVSLDNQNNVWVVGWTLSHNFDVKNATMQANWHPNAGFTGFISKFSNPAAPYIDGPSVVCPGANNILYVPQNIPVGASNQWTYNGIMSISVVAPGVKASFAPGFTGGQITNYATYANGCKELPVVKDIKAGNCCAGPAISISGITQVCHNQNNVVYSITTPLNGVSYHWIVTSPAVIVSGQGTSSIIVNFGNNVSAYSISVEVYNPTCVRNAFVQISAIDCCPPVNINQNDMTICNGNSVQLGFTTPLTPTIISWTPAISLNNSASATPTATPTSTTTYTLVVTYPAGCTATDNVKLEVLNAGFALDKKFDCVNRVYYIEYNKPGAATLQWQRKTTPGSWTNITNNTNRQDLNSSLIKYRVQVTLPSGCVVLSQEYDYTVPPNNFSILSPLTPSNDCSHKQRSVTATVMGGLSPLTYNWNYTAADMVETPAINANMISFYPNKATSVTFTVTDANGCSASQPVTVPVYAGSIVISGSQSVCSGTQTYTVPNVNGPFTFYKSLVKPNATAASLSQVPTVPQANVTFANSFTSMYLIVKNGNNVCGNLLINRNAACPPSRLDVSEEEVSSESQVQLYPNPAQEYATLLVTGESQEVFDVEVSTIEGVVVEKHKAYSKNTGYTIAEGLPSGVYMVKVIEENEVRLLRLIITR